MGLSIFYSLGLLPENFSPVEVDVNAVEVKLRTLAKTAALLAEGTGVSVSQIKILNTSGLAHAQATMSEDFEFARSACTPPGRDRRSPLGEVPKLAIYFRLSGRPEGGLCVGIAQYQQGAQFQMLGEDGNTEAPYDGRWYYWNFIDVFTPDEARLLKALLLEARNQGFETTYRNEAEDR